MMDKYPLPKRLKKILYKWHQSGVSEKDCKACSSACCSHGGFAVLDNVILIYEKYKKGQLLRTDYEFPTELSFENFVRNYFDVLCYPTGNWLFRKNIVIFHMRSLTNDNHLISIPEGGSYWEIRHSLFSRNTWLNKGCIFLNKKVPNWPEDDKDTSRVCILHNSDYNEMVTEKPIDCVFFTCITPMKCKDVTENISNQWQRALAVSFPDNEKRFKTMIDKTSEKKTV